MIQQLIRLAARSCAVGIGLAGLTAHADSVTNTVHFGYPYFSPSDITIHPGDTVLWVHDATDAFSHTVSICGPGLVPVSCSHTFDTAGAFAYECTVFGHAAAGMTGVVRVVSLPVSAAVLTNVLWLTNGAFQFTVLTTANQTNEIQATTNLLAAPVWEPLGSLVPTNNAFTFTDTNASRFQLRFYRVVQP